MKEAWKLYAKSRLPSNSISDKLELSKTRHNYVVTWQVINVQKVAQISKYIFNFVTYHLQKNEQNQLHTLNGLVIAGEQ